MNLFARSRANLNLTPSERALLKLIEGCCVAGIVAALPIVAHALGAQRLDGTQTLRTVAATFSVAVLLSIGKYLKAQNDPPLATTATTVAQTALTEIPRWAGVPILDGQSAAAPETLPHAPAADPARA